MEQKADITDNVDVRISVDRKPENRVYEISSYAPGKGMTEYHHFRAHKEDAYEDALKIANERITAMRKQIEVLHGFADLHVLHFSTYLRTLSEPAAESEGDE